MALICSCGTALPDNARFCHSCGKPQRDEDLVERQPEGPLTPVAQPAEIAAEPGIHFGNPVAMRVALLCGSVSALLNAIPIVSFGCCVWITGAGFMATYLYGRRTGLMLGVREGARLGWMTGLLCFAISIVFTALNFALARAAGTNFRDVMQQAMEKMPAQDQSARQILEFFMSPSGLVIFLLTYLVMSFLLMVSLSMAGGAMGAKVMEKD
jgi:hypothetical protein